MQKETPFKLSKEVSHFEMFMAVSKVANREGYLISEAMIAAEQYGERTRLEIRRPPTWYRGPQKFAYVEFDNNGGKVNSFKIVQL